ncbi:MAG: DnaK suppressor protein, partial [Frankiaceae bacterium]|nr:DnaK suppressor protein [Frankiaceae bacterium]
MTDEKQRARLEAALAENAEQLRDLQRQYEDFVAASRDSNADDEHDPEGATIAFERQQVVALIAAAGHSRADIQRGL